MRFTKLKNQSSILLTNEHIIVLKLIRWRLLYGLFADCIILVLMRISDFGIDFYFSQRSGAKFLISGFRQNRVGLAKAFY